MNDPQTEGNLCPKEGAVQADMPLVSVVITTRNRKAALLRAIESCCAQTYRPLEVLVYDDASTDGTGEAVRTRFPEVRYHRTEHNVGLVALRNRGLHEAQGVYLFSIDDDAYYSDRGTIDTIVQVFEANGRIGAVAMAFVEPLNTRPESCRTYSPGQCMRSFVGCSHGLRREAALEGGGYREFFFRQGEERDLCLRMMDHDFDIVYARTCPVFHMYSPVRDREAMSYLGVRNTLLFDFLNVPHPYLIPRLAKDAAQLLVYRIRWTTILTRLGYVVGGLGACIRYAKHRHPVARAVYRRYRSLPAHCPELAEQHTFADVSCRDEVPLSQIEARRS